MNKWHVLPDPQWENKHHVHKFRYVCTASEWEFVEPYEHGERWNFGFCDSGSNIICKLMDSKDIARNARLIAAAPEMLDALEYAQIALSANPGNGVALGFVESAIRSAKGENP